jgi:hypothetical protein
MNAKGLNQRQVLYLQLAQIVAGVPINAGFLPKPEEYGADLALHIGYNSGENISHITMEFRDAYRAKFLVCILFDGSGDKGTGLSGVAMPKVKLPRELKALVALSCLTYLCSRGHLKADPEYFRMKIADELFQESVAQRGSVRGNGPGSNGRLLNDFDSLTQLAVSHVAEYSAA